MSKIMSLAYLPDVALENVFHFLSYDEIAKSRMVCKKFNEIGGRLLSRGFIRLEKRHSAIYKQVKSSLPRRESERRVHPLARHCDILQAVETRISMLNMTYMKYIENNLLCFIPGKVLDEMESVLNLVEHSTSPPRTHQLLQELRDLSSMAMEHFDEHILPRVKEQMDRKTARMTSYQHPNSPRFLLTQKVMLDEMNKMKKCNKIQRNSISTVYQNTLKLSKKTKRQSVRIRLQYILIREQERRLQEQAAKIQEQETTIAEMKRHIDEWDQKYIDLTAEFVRARDDILTKAGSIPKITSTPHVQSKLYIPNIKPRVAQIKNYSVLNVEVERKRKAPLTFTEAIPNKLFVYENEKTENVLNVEKEFSMKEPFKKDKIIQTEINEESSSLTPMKKNDMNSDIISRINSLLPVKGRKRKMCEDIDLK